MSLTTVKTSIVAYGMASALGGFLDSFFPAEVNVSDDNWMKVTAEVLVQAAATAYLTSAIAEFTFRRFADNGDATRNIGLIAGMVHSQKNLGHRTDSLLRYIRDKAGKTAISFGAPKSAVSALDPEYTAPRVVRTPMNETASRI